MKSTVKTVLAPWKPTTPLCTKSSDFHVFSASPHRLHTRFASPIALYSCSSSLDHRHRVDPLPTCTPCLDGTFYRVYPVTDLWWILLSLYGTY